jgi:hypothetical protein
MLKRRAQVQEMALADRHLTIDPLSLIRLHMQSSTVEKAVQPLGTLMVRSPAMLQGRRREHMPGGVGMYGLGFSRFWPAVWSMRTLMRPDDVR